MRIAQLWLVVGTFVGTVMFLAACDKPSEDNCRKALANMRQLLGTDKLSQVQLSVEGEVRRCRGGSSSKSVKCAIEAKTIDELRACKLIEIKDTPTPTTDPASTPAPTPPPAASREPAAEPATDPATETSTPPTPTPTPTPTTPPTPKAAPAAPPA